MMNVIVYPPKSSENTDEEEYIMIAAEGKWEKSNSLSVAYRKGCICDKITMHSWLN